MVDALLVTYIVLFFFGIYFMIFLILLYNKNKENFRNFPIITRKHSLSIVIPVYNEEKEINNTIKSILDSDYSGLKKVIAVDDCSRDSSYRILKEMERKYPKLLVVQTPKNTGCAAGAKNYGAKFVNTELIGFVDSDSILKKDAISKMVGHFDSESVAAVTSKVWIRKKKNNFLEKFQDVDYRVIMWSKKIIDFIECVYVTNGPLSLYRTRLFKLIGGFDEKNLTEDIEITWNFLSKGYETRMSYMAVVYASVPFKLKEWINQRIRWNIGGLQTIWKYRKFFLRKSSALFGNFVMVYVSLSFALALLGLALLLRAAYFKLYPYVLGLPYIFQGYSPISSASFLFPITILFLLGIFFLLFSLVFHFSAFKDSELRHKGILTIFVYIFIYRALYMIPLVVALYKLLKRDISWGTRGLN